ncbi:putative Overexpressor of cationic peroxidase 3 [Melia azedarach]|uniref:Overexpressor of cationic peroxidase 3 n=1 Tax=Melia azedarach TaxID=155640 RepID=A0ACC1X9B1_MELAZ|nr:putative Overexpressor of cationic peroxidase 3 [Melia azedarach]
MALALSMSLTSGSRAVHCLSPSYNELLFAGHLKTLNLVLPRHSLSRFTLAFSRRRNNGPAITSSSSKKKKKSLPLRDDDDAFEDDPFEALFSQLEEDLKNDDSTIDDDNDDEINEEDLDKLALELEEALGDVDMEITATEEEEEEEEEEDDYDDDDDDKEDDDDDEEEREVRLKNWQLRKLAYALKKGRRRVSIKTLAAELCLDRSVVLEMLREPPPNLLMLSAALPDEPAAKVLVHEVKHTETIMAETTVHAVEPETKEEEPVHDRQHRWSAQKRLKKVQVKTLEMVYRRSKRPTNAMISSIVQVTNLPRRRIVKWFEDKRAEEGVPEYHKPYQRAERA